MPNNRIVAFDMTRGAAVALVVFGHMIMLGADYARNPAPPLHLYSVLIQLMTPLRMPVIFLISGIVSASLLSKSIGDTARRVSHFAWLYLIWMPVAAIFSPNGPVRDPIGLMSEFIAPTTHLWFLWAILIFTALLPMVRHLPKWPFLMVVAGLAFTSYAFQPDEFSYANTLHYAVYFFTGALLRQHFLAIGAQAVTKVGLGLVGAAMAVVMAIGVVVRMKVGWNAFALPMSMTLGMGSLYLMHALSALTYPRIILSWLGRHTLSIYVLHFPMMTLIRPFAPADRIIGPLLAAGFLILMCLAFERMAKRNGLKWMFERPQWLIDGVDAMVPSRGVLSTR